PMPVVMQFLAHEWQLGCRTAPEIVVDSCRNPLRPVHLADAGTPLVTEAARDLDFADVSFLDPRPRFGKSEIGTALCAGLDDAAIFACSFDDFSPFPHVVRDRFFHIDILAC